MAEAFPLVGRAVLIVENEWLIGADLARTFQLGGALPYVATGISGALEIISREELAAAVLEIGLVDGDCGPVCRALTNHTVPFLIYSGAAQLPRSCAGALVLKKPANARTVYEAALRLVEGRGYITEMIESRNARQFRASAVRSPQ
jgi:DNA-binding response OmpR family regulator